MINQKTKSLIEIHISVVLFGVSGLFGKLITSATTTIVFGRVLFASFILGLILLVTKQSIKLKSQKDYLGMWFAGLVLAVHWLTFFYSIKVSTVAIGLISYSTFPVFTTFMEPLFFKEKLKISNIILALITVAGVALIIPNFEPGHHLTQGVIWGVVSGLAFAVLSILNRRFVQQYSGLVIAFHQNVSIACCFIPLLLFMNFTFDTKEIMLLMTLGVFFTAAPHLLFIRGLAHTKAQVASIIANMEAVYGILFALILLGEIPSVRTLVGGSFILGATFLASIDLSQILIRYHRMN